MSFSCKAKKNKSSEERNYIDQQKNKSDESGLSKAKNRDLSKNGTLCRKSYLLNEKTIIYLPEVCEVNINSQDLLLTRRFLPDSPKTKFDSPKTNFDSPKIKTDIEKDLLAKNFTEAYRKVKEYTKQKYPGNFRGIENAKIDEIMKKFKVSDFSRTTQGNLSSKIRAIEQDIILLDTCLISMNRAKLKTSISEGIDLEKLEKGIKDSKHNLEVILGDYGRAMAAISMAKNIRKAQFFKIAESLEQTAPKLSSKIKEMIDEKDIIDLEKMKLNGGEKELLIRQLKAEPIALLSRGVQPPGYARQASGYAGKPLTLKMKSNPETGFIPVKTDYTPKVDSSNPKEVEKFQHYSNDAFSLIESDGLPTSVQVPRSHTLLSPEGKRIEVFEASIEIGGKKNITWMTEDELLNAEYPVEKIYYHADPRGMPGSNTKLLEEWRMEKAEKLSRLKTGPERAESYAEFLSERMSKNISVVESPMYVADIDLASISTKNTRPAEEIVDLGNLNQGVVSKSHLPVLKYKGDGFISMRMQEQIKHGSEFNNRSFPQRAAKDYPFTLVYTKKSGEIHFEIIKKGPDSDIHRKLFERIHDIKKETNLDIMLNPADFIKNSEDYIGIVDILLPSQKKVIQDYLKNIPEDSIFSGKTVQQIRKDLGVTY